MTAFPAATSTTPSTAVVVCAYTVQRAQTLLAALAEARRQSEGSRDEVVLVVDHAPDLLALAREEVAPGVVVVENTGARGLSGARNTGTEVTTADLVVFLDDDALPRPGWLQALRAAAADPSVAAVACAVEADWEGGAPPPWFPEEFGWVVGCDYRGLPGNGELVRNPIGAAMAVRREALQAAGGFSSELGRVGVLPAGCEETLMGIRVRETTPGARIVRITGSQVTHAVPRARQSVGYFLSRCFHEGRSKAILVGLAGAGAGLSSERSYLVRQLPSAVTRGVRDAGRGDLAGLGRATAVAAGLVATCAGYFSGRVAPARRATAAPVPSGPRRSDSVSVVVCTLGRDARLLGTIAAVLGQSHADLELVVVDNDPGSGRLRALLEEGPHHQDPRLRVVDEPVRGLSAARNAGLEAARGDLLAYTDDDAVPDADWIEQLLAVVRRDKQAMVALVTGRVLAAETVTDEQRWFEQSGIFDKGEQLTTWALRGVPVDPALGRPGVRSAFFPYTAGEIGSGNNMLFRTDVLRALGGFDEALGAGSRAQGGEDLDIFRRVVLAGHVAVYTPTAVVRHFHRDSYEALRQQMHGYGIGMAAVLTKILFEGGRPALAVLRCLPRGVWTLLAPSSTKNAKRPDEMPQALVRTELVGYLRGPFLYLASRRTARERRAAAGRSRPPVRDGR